MPGGGVPRQALPARATERPDPSDVPDLEAIALDGALRARVRRHLDAFVPLRAAAEHDALVRAAVAITLVDDGQGEACFVLTRRAPRLASHGGQWALPGGRVDGDETPVEAALRELAEEVGLACPEDSVLGLLDDYPTRSGFVITPVVVWGGAACELRPDPREVATVHRVPLHELDGPDVPRLRSIPESQRPLISIPLGGTVQTDVHAPTAAVVFQFREVALHGRATRVAHYEQPLFAWR
ncbi:CoA pyrophosphatase [Candidatus Binatia bacterium]|nr:CoA pyrophosphatase [Candidatus Binatia bacterium]